MRKTTLLAAGALILAACGGAGDGTTAPTTNTMASVTSTSAAPTTTLPTTTTTAGPTTTTEALPPADHTMVISGFAFNGPSQVAVGAVVEARNDDGVPHTWTSDDGVWDSGGLSGDATFRFTFDQAGTFAFHCAIHPEMKGSITVGG